MLDACTLIARGGNFISADTVRFCCVARDMSKSSRQGDSKIAPLCTSDNVRVNTIAHRMSVATEYIAPHTRKKGESSVR
ncbi:hypothetical protein NUW54_g6770 [Trametes sanguinea]|uniref:Uncharacterized protein n=1 Tax=Trametes sanguinea TaxID=158606 RepID=A0ACC1PRB0_9APHY|nr:hypothetical protein NUW54_g6770 [Trametes sanguinea]